MENAKKICENKFTTELATADMVSWSDYEKCQCKLKKTVKDALYEATYVSDKEMPGYSNAASMYSFAFLFVLVGVELDFWGFIIAFPQYWKFDGPHHLIVKFFLICMPMAYVVSVLWCYFYERPQTLEDLLKDCDQAEPETTLQLNVPKIAPTEFKDPTVHSSSLADIFSASRPTQDQAIQGKGRVDNSADVRVAPHDAHTEITIDTAAKQAHQAKVRQQELRQTIREKPTFLWFRTMPLARLYLVTKNLKRDDVELIFRLNSLSSFSLGVSQLVCVGFTVLLAGEPLNTIVMVNMMSQAINWMITFIYYASALADHMKASIAIKAVSQHLRDRQQRDLVLFFEAVRRVADDKAEEEVTGRFNNKDGEDEVQRMKAALLAEIFFLTKCDVNLARFSVAELLEYRRRLYKKQIHYMMKG